MNGARLKNDFLDPARLKGILGRTGALYLAVILLFLGVVNQRGVKYKILDELRPPLDYLVLLSDGKIDPERERFAGYLRYYRLAAEVLPNNADIQGFLGFCYYHLGDLDRAAAHHEKALKLNPHFFWHGYNLGVMAYNRGDYAAAIKFFKQALNVDRKFTMLALSQSFVYTHFDDPNWDFDGVPRVNMDHSDLVTLWQRHLNRGYASAFELSILSAQKLERYPEMVQLSLEALKTPFADKGLFYYYLGVGSFYMKDFSDAVRALELSARIDPGRTDTYRYLSRCFRELGRHDLAEGFRQKAASPGSAPATLPSPPRLKIF